MENLVMCNSPRDFSEATSLRIRSLIKKDLLADIVDEDGGLPVISIERTENKQRYVLCPKGKGNCRLVIYDTERCEYVESPNGKIKTIQLDTSTGAYKNYYVFVLSERERSITYS